MSEKAKLLLDIVDARSLAEKNRLFIAFVKL